MTRPAKSGEAARQRSIRLTDKEWESFIARGGTDWLRSKLKQSDPDCQHPFKTRRLIDTFSTCVECGWQSEPDTVTL